MKNIKMNKVNGEFDPQFCFQIFRKNGKVVMINFDPDDAHEFAKNTDAYDEIYWCRGNPTEYKNEMFVDKY